MDKEEFVKNYCARSAITVEFFNKTQVALPCNCYENGCYVKDGWVAISKNKVAIKAHTELYMVDADGDQEYKNSVTEPTNSEDWTDAH